MVTPCKVRFPETFSVLPFFATLVLTKVAVGNWATSKKFGPFRSLSRDATPVSTVPTSIVTLTLDLVIYKWYDAEQKPVLFPFGFGLSYTTYAYSGLSVKAADGLSISFKIKNSGRRAGSEIAQVYAGSPEATGEPPKRLIGWARVDLAPGEEKQVTVSGDRSRLTVFDEATDSWKLVPGNYDVQVGRSSRELPLHQEVSMQ